VEGNDPITGVRLIAEHRTQPLGRSAHWKFTLYWWLLVRYGSTFMCKLLFDAVKRRAEHGVDPHPFKSLAGRAAYCAAYDAALRRWPAAYESRTVSTSFGSTQVLISGPESAPPLVLLHGMCMSATMWGPNIADWSRTRRVYAVDTIGDIGRSVATRPLRTQAEYVAWYREVLDGLGIHSADVLGLSYGGWIALSAAVHAPERVKRLILCDPAASFAPLRTQFWLRVVPSLLMPLRPVTRHHLRWFLTPGSVTMREMDEQWFQGWKHFNQAGAAFPTVFSDADLRGLSAPTLLLIGEDEVIYPNRDAVLGRARRLVPKLEADFVPGARHVPTVEQPAWTNARVLRFLEATPV
jgi:pimeloyl-ACP methyl ester carboxylesterase